MEHHRPSDPRLNNPWDEIEQTLNSGYADNPEPTGGVEELTGFTCSEEVSKMLYKSDSKTIIKGGNKY